MEDSFRTLSMKSLSSGNSEGKMSGIRAKRCKI